MNPEAHARRASVGRFRIKLLIAMALVVSAMTVAGLYLAQRKVEIEAERDLLKDFRNELATLHGVQQVRRAGLAERCRDLVKRARIHASLEDGALDLLYPSAHDELRDVLEPAAAGRRPRNPLHARFYRFLDNNGAVITPPEGENVGELAPTEEASLTLPTVPKEQQLGYLWRAEGNFVDEVMAMPIHSMQNGEVIAALVLGFEPVELGGGGGSEGIRAGIWMHGRLHLPELAPHEQVALAAELPKVIATQVISDHGVRVNLGGTEHLLFWKQLNPDSLFPPAYEVAVYPLAEALARRQQIRWHVLIAGGALLVVGLFASQFIATRLAAPVEELAVVSEENLAHWQKAESALEATHEELQRAARFSADASHQLKTPVTVLRAGIEELLLRDDFAPEIYDALSALLHQTYRITGVVDDLLLLSQMDAGRLQIQFKPVDLTQLIEEWLEDFDAVPDELQVRVETDAPAGLQVLGDKSYVSLILQNLLENARKYNRSGGLIRMALWEEGEFAILTVGNTGRTISPKAREHIFERFHRGEVGENIGGHGLGLSLARELARLHGGELRLVRSADDWTEFEVRFRMAQVQTRAAAAVL